MRILTGGTLQWLVLTPQMACVNTSNAALSPRIIQGMEQLAFPESEEEVLSLYSDSSLLQQVRAREQQDQIPRQGDGNREAAQLQGHTQELCKQGN